MHYEPAEVDAPTENLWSSELYLEFVPKLFERLRREFGSALHLLYDAHHRLPLSRQLACGRVSNRHLFWLEDPVPAELQESFRLIKQHTTTALAVGEAFDNIYDCQQLIQEQLIDYIRTTPSSRRRYFAPSQNRKSGGDVSRKDRITRRYRSQPGLHGRCSAL